MWPYTKYFSQIKEIFTYAKKKKGIIKNNKDEIGIRVQPEFTSDSKNYLIICSINFSKAVFDFHITVLLYPRLNEYIFFKFPHGDFAWEVPEDAHKKN